MQARDNPGTTASSLGQQPQSTLPPSTLHSHTSGSVVNSWAQGAAAASNVHHQQVQKQQQLQDQQTLAGEGETYTNRCEQGEHLSNSLFTLSVGITSSGWQLK
jgi:hypothetical protein